MISSQQKTTIILIRHGECEGNREGLFRGRWDFPLNENGKLQAQAIAKEISANFKLDRIYSSPLSRALETARSISKATGAQIEIRNGFNNISLGSWEGKPKRKSKKNSQKNGIYGSTIQKGSGLKAQNLSLTYKGGLLPILTT